MPKVDGLLFRELLIKVGGSLPPRRVRAFDALANYLTLGSWLRRSGIDAPMSERAKDRDEIFRAMAARQSGGQVLYLEFGVFEGASIRRWTELIGSPDARFVGFDSFEGLPRAWTDEKGIGTFSTGGRVPDIVDPRVSFVVGWFEETVPSFAVPPHDQLIVTLDADLYSSTQLVLDHLKPHIRPGTILYFDELNGRHDEQRAFAEFVDATGMRFRLIAATRAIAKAAFERVA